MTNRKQIVSPPPTYDLYIGYLRHLQPHTYELLVLLRVLETRLYVTFLQSLLVHELLPRISFYDTHIGFKLD